MFEENEETIQNKEKENQRGRAWRRSQNKRIENKALKMLKVSDVHYWNMEDSEQRHNLLLVRAKRQKNHMKMCSCHMCGNPRYPKHIHLSRATDLAEIKYFFKVINNKF